MNRDQIVPDGRWEFDENVTDVFDEMLERSIPGYNEMRTLTTDLAVHFANAVGSGFVVDLGTSRGGALKPIINYLGGRFKYLGIEVSEPMRTAALADLSSWVDAGLLNVIDLDLRDDYPVRPAAVTLAVLAMCFVPIEYRQKVIANAYQHTQPGGAFLMVEKVLGSDAYSNSLLVDLYYNRKGANGYTPEQVNAKRRSLEGVLVPVTPEMNVELLRSAGWSHVECYWRSLNFAAWVGVK